MVENLSLNIVMTAQPLCYAPFRNLRINTLNSGKQLMRPCCMYQEFNTDFKNIQDYLQSDLLKTAQANMFANELPKECIACKTQEQNGQKSAREFMLEYFETDTGGITQLETESSNVCNLKCWMCNEDNSSSIAAERKALGWITSYQEVDKTDCTIDIIKNLDTLTRVTFIGGEFFLSKRNVEILELVADQQIGVRVVTNATILLPRHLEVLKRIPDLGIQVSMEGIDDCYEFMRWPGKWDVVKNNIIKLKKELPHAQLNVNCVVQPMNIHRITEMLEWLNPLIIPVRLVNLGFPFWLTWSILTQEEKQHIVELLKNQLTSSIVTKQQRQSIEDFVETIINTKHDPAQRLEFVDRMQQLLPHRRINKDRLTQQLLHLPALVEQVLP
jgi:molybdenum cofactor biosynthesis enzyme MoaA